MRYIVKKDAIEIDLDIIKSLAQKIEQGGSVGGNARGSQPINTHRVQLYSE